ncbi:MAG: J domain-containing protein [Kofleriaceae bacterium]|nr:J domain-containing protein [Kofleriaceae bacterium]
MRDPYKALGVESDASASEIKKAYRSLAKKYHPDRTGGDKKKEDRFKQISSAYDILSDSDKRAQFDTMASGGGGIPAGDLSDIFAQMFSGQRGGQRGGQRQGNPFGGMGGSPFGGMGGSPFGGMGGAPQQQRRPAPKAPAKPAPPKERLACDGSTLIQKGSGLYSDLRIPFHEAMVGIVAKVPTLSGVANVRVPPGTSSGQKLRLKGKGAPRKPSKANSSPHGDHIVTIHIDVPKVEGSKSSALLAKLVKSLGKDKS